MVGIFERLIDLFADEGGFSGGGSSGRRAPDAVPLAAATLMVEAARMDGAIGTAERARILEICRDRFGLDAAESQDLLAAALAESAGAAQWYGLTALLKDRLDAAGRIAIVEMLWEVAYADGRLHDFEASLLRRIGGLLYVSDRDRGEARLRVLARLGIADPSTEP